MRFCTERNLNVYWTVHSLLVPLGHMMIGRSLKWVESCNQLPITEVVMNMTDIANINKSLFHKQSNCVPIVWLFVQYKIAVN